MERLSLYLFYHNYLKVHRVRWGPLTNAIVAGYEAGQIAEELDDLWERRAMLSLTDLTDCSEDSWRRARTTTVEEGLADIVDARRSAVGELWFG
jgi:hypothetical protein